VLESPDTIGGLPACRICDGPVIGAGYVLAHDWSLAVSCSEKCLRAARRAERRRRWAARARGIRRLTIGVTLLGACVTAHGGAARRPRAAHALAASSTVPPGPPPLPRGWFGPEWPPTETSLLAELGQDAWIHPLAGPFRRMPRADSRVFGALRPGDRPIECRNGHCGVDLGGEIWGEHVHAAHDGVVDWVQRGPNPDRGGEFVRLSHRGGTVFTQYFHLAAIPRGLERGAPVKSGDVIGLLGDTGVKESEPHLHFAISVRPTKEGPERYIDPEPLIALWPLRVPLDGGEAGLVTTVAEPGLPLGSALLRRGHGRKHQARNHEATEQPRDEGDGASEQAPAEDEPAPASDGAPAVESPGE